MPTKGNHFQKLDEEKAKEAVRLYESGLSIQDVGEFFGTTRQSMWKVLRKRTKLRPQKRAGKNCHFWRGSKKNRAVESITWRAIQRGILKRQACEVCGVDGKKTDGTPIVEAHHDDYNKPLNVRWLCQRHHYEWHKNNKAILLSGPSPGMTRQQISSLGAKAKAAKRRASMESA